MCKNTQKKLKNNNSSYLLNHMIMGDLFTVSIFKKIFI